MPQNRFFDMLPLESENEDVPVPTSNLAGAPLFLGTSDPVIETWSFFGAGLFDKSCKTCMTCNLDEHILRQFSICCPLAADMLAFCKVSNRLFI